MALTINDVTDNYDFLKSDEAKQIFLNLKKIEFVEEHEFFDEDDFVEWRDSMLPTDDEKQYLVARLSTAGWTLQDGRDLAEQKCNKNRLLEVLQLKEDLDPDYIYENWLYEKEKMFSKMKLQSFLDEDFSYVEFLENYKV
ncbi:hypothetical protein QM920_09955 [Streptococcus mitis]|uniref:hypothetical protein n=1 Tax=Streptococcus mitis TaxID=28037 RepID=UPI0039C2D0AB